MNSTWLEGEIQAPGGECGGGWRDFPFFSLSFSITNNYYVIEANTFFLTLFDLDTVMDSKSITILSSPGVNLYLNPSDTEKYVYERNYISNVSIAVS